MAEDSKDESQKTEEPTQKRLQDALERGQVVHSRELTNFLMFLGMTILIFSVMPGVFSRVVKFCYFYFSQPEDFIIDFSSLHTLFTKIIIFFITAISLPFLMITLVSVISSISQIGGFNLSTEPLMPDFSRISMLSGLKRLFSFKSIFEFLKSIIKIIITAIALYFSIKPHLSEIILSYEYENQNILSLIFSLTKSMFIVTTIILLVIGGADFLYQKYEYIKSLRMTKEEIKEEYKQQEGSPEIKSKIRQIRAARARNRMMSSVPNAHVIITNPTHYSIALEYDMKTMTAPKVIAKGLDLIALKIREIAKEHHIPLVESPALARNLYSAVNIDQEVPLEYYEAVAEIINYVYKMKNKV